MRTCPPFLTILILLLLVNIKAFVKNALLIFYHSFTILLPFFYHSFTILLSLFYHSFIVLLSFFYRYSNCSTINSVTTIRLVLYFLFLNITSLNICIEMSRTQFYFYSFRQESTQFLI